MVRGAARGSAIFLEVAMVPTRAVPVVSGLLLGVLALPAFAQEVQYTTTSKVELSGGLGTVMRLFGGGGETTEKSYLKGGLMRTDSDDESTIMDLENGRIIQIDHKAKTYTILTFDQMVETAQQAATQAREEVNREAAAAGEPQGEVELDYRLDVDATGERQRINGYDAERIFLTMETEATVTTEEGDQQKAGRLVVFMDMWNAQDDPISDAMEAYYARAPEAMRRTAEAAEGTMAAMAANPQMQKAMEEAAKETEKLGGFTLRSTTYMVMVSAGETFDRAKLLEEKKDEPRQSGARRALGGLLRGAAGVESSRRDEENQPPPTQFAIAKIISETKDIRTGSIPDDLFQPPASYTERPFTMPAMRD